MEKLENLEDILYKIFLRSPNNLFDEFIIECQKWYEKPAHTLVELRMRDNKKIKGDIFEKFCLLYLKYIKGYKNVWLLKDVPQTVLDKLKMIRRDMGIDIIAENDTDLYSAIQCKYKKGGGFRKNILSWKSLSTFYGLCLRTGPWDKYIVMTNCIYTRFQGEKTIKDISYCLKTFQSISKDEWLLMCNTLGHKLSDQHLEKEFNDLIINQINIQPNDEIQPNDKIKPNHEIKPKSKKKIKIPSKEELRNLRNSYYNQNI